MEPVFSVRARGRAVPADSAPRRARLGARPRTQRRGEAGSLARGPELCFATAPGVRGTVKIPQRSV